MKIREKIRKIGSMLPVLVLGILACATVAMACLLYTSRCV